MATKRKRNTPKRKSKLFGDVVRLITKDSLLTIEELTAGLKDEEIEKDDKGRLLVKSPNLPPDTVAVDTLNGTFAYNKNRLERHVEVMKTVLQEFGDEFFTADDGASVAKLKRDKKGRTWADDQTVLHMCYTAVAMDLAIWTHTRKEWAALPHGLPFIKFACEKTIDEVELNS